jgi:hypothetical protein
VLPSSAPAVYDAPRPEIPSYLPSSAAPAPAAAVLPLTQSSWYTRIDYFHWNERVDGQDFVNESGALWTVGYQRRVGRERFRGELFFGDVDYQGGAQLDDGTSEPLSSRTDYLGLRGEYEFLIEPEGVPQRTFFLGVGTRLSIRDLKDGVGDYGSPIMGYRETWWTFYPYMGMEGRYALGGGGEFYASCRVGLTPLTYEHVSFFDVALYPRLGVMGGTEFGFRAQHFFIAGEFEAMTWSRSPRVNDPYEDGAIIYQPSSMMYTVGLKTGFAF